MKSGQRGVDVDNLIQITPEVLEAFSADNQPEEIKINLSLFTILILLFRDYARTMESFRCSRFTNTRIKLDSKANLESFWRTYVAPKTNRVVYSPFEDLSYLLPHISSNADPSE